MPVTSSFLSDVSWWRNNMPAIFESLGPCSRSVLRVPKSGGGVIGETTGIRCKVGIRIRSEVFRWTTMQYSRTVIERCTKDVPSGAPGHVAMGNLCRTCVVCVTILVAIALSLTSCLDAHGSATFRKALQAAQSGKLDRAVELWTIAIRRNPRNYAARVNRGSAYLLSGKVLQGLRDWHKANECAPLFAYGVYSPGFIQEVNRNALLLNYARHWSWTLTTFLPL